MLPCLVSKTIPERVDDGGEDILLLEYRFVPPKLVDVAPSVDL